MTFYSQFMNVFFRETGPAFRFKFPTTSRMRTEAHSESFRVLTELCSHDRAQQRGVKCVPRPQRIDVTEEQIQK